jgi:hypothetical protein
MAATEEQMLSTLELILPKEILEHFTVTEHYLASVDTERTFKINQSLM